MVESDLIFGLKVLAKIHTGEIDISCNNCDERMKLELYCSGVSEYPIYTDDEYEAYSCPLKWLNTTIYNLIDEYNYYECFPGTAPKYGQHNERFWESVKIYKAAYNKSLEDKRNKPNMRQLEQKTTSSLSKLKESLKRKKHEPERN